MKVRSAVVEEINAHVCLDCDLVEANIRKDEFSCRGGLTTSIVYRAMIVGTDSYSAPSLVSFVQSWVASGSASLTLFSSRLHLDKFCNTTLDTFNEPDCPKQVETNTSLKVTTYTSVGPGLSTLITVKSEDKVPNNIDIDNAPQVRGGEIGGFVIGSIIAMLLLMLILIIVFLAVRKRFSRKFHRR